MNLARALARRRRRRSWALAICCGFGAAPSAHAQTAQISDANVHDVEQITVQGRIVTTRDLPMAAHSVSGGTLETFGASTYAEAANFFPGFSVQEQSPNIPGFVMRGVTTDSGAAFVQSRIGLFRDGAPAARNRGAYTELFDIDRIEVVRGPQPTLFGRNAMTGAVNVIENKADMRDSYAFGEIEAGANGYGRALGVLNWGAPNGHFAARLAGTSREADGFVDDLNGGDALGSYRVHAARAAFAFAPDPNLRFDLLLNIHQDDNAGTAFKSNTFAPPGGDLGPYTPAALNHFVPGFDGDAGIGLNREVDSAALIANWRLNPSLSVSSISSVRNFDSLEVFDADGSPLPLLFGLEDAQGRQLSQEVRLVIENAGPVSGFLGASFLQERGSQRVATAYNEHFFLPLLLGVMHGPNSPSQSQADALSFAALTAPPSVGGLGLAPDVANALISALAQAHSEYYKNSSESQSLDLFADFTLALTEQFEVSAGLRYAYDDKTTGLEAGNLNGSSPLGAMLALLLHVPLSGPPGLFFQPQSPISMSGDFEGSSWRLAATLKASDGVVLWGSYTEGATPNVIAMSAGNLPGSRAVAEVLPEETLRSLEFGVRAEDTARHLRVDASVFHYDYSDFQTTAIVSGAFRSVNAGQARALGAEMNVAWRLTPSWSLVGAYAYNHARFTTGARKGNQFRLSPDHFLSLGASYSRRLEGLGGEVNVDAFYDWRSKIYFDNDNDRSDLQPPLIPGAASLRDRTVDEYQDPYGLLNLRLDFRADGQRWSIGAFVDNALDKRYLLDAGNLGDSFTIPTFIRGPGRLFGADLSWRL